MTHSAEKDAGTEFGGLTHHCGDPDCHVAGFVATLKLVDTPPSVGSDEASIKARWARTTTHGGSDA